MSKLSYFNISDDQQREGHISRGQVMPLELDACARVQSTAPELPTLAGSNPTNFQKSTYEWQAKNLNTN